MLSLHIDGLHPTDRIISYLPLSHIAAQILDVICPIIAGACVTFARPDALKGTITMTLAAVKPTIFFGVPRVWEKIMAKIKAAGAGSKGLKKSLVTWAKGVAAAYSDSRQGFNTSGVSNFKTAASPCGYSCADCLVLSKVKGILGLTEARVLITGAAPIAKECLDFFAALDLPIMEVYGQSECTGPATCTSPSVGWKAGTVGPVIPGTTMRIGKNEEIQYTGRHIFMGYMGMEQKSKDTLTEDGWLASGDQGKFDEDQFLSITGRIKELIIGAGGENIAPVVVEKVLKKHMTFLSNVVVFGDNKPYLGIMVSLEVVPDPASGLPTDELTPGVKTWAASIGSDATTYSAAKTCEKINAAVEAALKSAIAAKEKGMVSSAAQPKFHIWLPEELTNMGEAPTLTATLKLKRKAVMELYADVVEKGYVDQTAKFAKK
jgi:long-chain-fatty-acid--CoA ligase ACSBG